MNSLVKSFDFCEIIYQNKKKRKKSQRYFTAVRTTELGISYLMLTRGLQIGEENSHHKTLINIGKAISAPSAVLVMVFLSCPPPALTGGFLLGLKWAQNGSTCLKSVWKTITLLFAHSSVMALSFQFHPTRRGAGRGSRNYSKEHLNLVAVSRLWFTNSGS